jgi:hypothetical protein
VTRELRLDAITEQIAEFDGKGGESKHPRPKPENGTQLPFTLPASVVVSRPVTTPESSEALSKLVAARERLAGITRQLIEANALYMSVKAGRRYEKLQKEWEEAFTEFNVARAAYPIANLPEFNRFKLGSPGG